MRPTSAKLTYDDFLLFPDDGLRHELIAGEHYVTPSPAVIHQRLVSRLHVALFAYLDADDLGEVFTAPLDVVLSVHDVVEPDLLVVLSDQAGILTEGNVRGAPAIVVEVGSPSTRGRDEGIKRRLYERAGVREYWMVDPRSRTVTVCMFAGTVPDRVLPRDGVLTSPVLPGFSLRLAQLFR
jgi:Uma2 family endonuclease